MKLSKFLSIILVMCLMMTLFASCDANNGTEDQSNGNQDQQIGKETQVETEEVTNAEVEEETEKETEKETEPVHVHEFSNWTVVTPATCDEDGTMTRYCPCGKQETETITTNGHSWVNATCTVPKTCNVCKRTEGDALGHTTQFGTCSRCNQNISITPTISFSKSYYKIYFLYEKDGKVVNPGTARGVLDDLSATVDVKSNGKCNIELALKGEVERVENSKSSLSFYLYVYDAAGNIVYPRKLIMTSSYAKGDKISVYKTIYDLPYSSSYTIKIGLF
jgi:hypothetical protein